MNPVIGHSASPLKCSYDTYRRLKDQAGRQARSDQVAATTALASATTTKPRSGPAPRAPAPPPAAPRKPGKLSFKDQREYEGIEAAIQAAEERKAALEASMADPATYQRGGADWAKLRKDFDEATAEVERLYARWEALEALKAGG